RRHTRCYRDWSSDVCSSDLVAAATVELGLGEGLGDDGALAFCGGIIAVGGGVIISTFSFSEGSVVRSGKCGIFCSFTWEKAAPRSEERRVGKECRTRRWTRE